MTRSFFSLLVLLVRQVGGMQDYWMVITKVTNESLSDLVFFVRLLGLGPVLSIEINVIESGISSVAYIYRF